MEENGSVFKKYIENSEIKMAVMSVVGDRADQQDSISYNVNDDFGIVTVCDGMGGHNGGKAASTLASSVIMESLLANNTLPINEQLCAAFNEADKAVAGLKDVYGQRLNAGTTAVAVYIKRRQLFWASVGDSRLYILRNEDLARLTEDHIYQKVLDKKRKNNQINGKKYAVESRKGGALFSFLGVDGLPAMCSNPNPFNLLKDDRLILMSDGLYKLVSDLEIRSILSNFKNIEDALSAFEMKARRSAKEKKLNRDNMTVVIVKIQ